ncbi:putative molybdopterin-binding oxidoreductase [Escherichia coli]|uniref:Putative molybdopterin-binding oxidoreductase n=1 Tax=Escherichia coli TaxID=562 RepID=A0A377BHY9_ECOLX|nr:putative molybdopterin-binding oxidoreductase [Escherichia coli]
MGGNFALAMPDREASAVPLTQLDLAVHVATKLNRSHLLTARHSYFCPVLGRSEIGHAKKAVRQAVTVEDSMSMIHASRGVLKPAGVMLKSECAVGRGNRAGSTTPERGSLGVSGGRLYRIRMTLKLCCQSSPIITSASDILVVFT